MYSKYSSIGYLSSVLYRLGQRYLDNELKKYAIGSGQFIFLLVLFSQDNITQEKLASLIGIDKGTTARAIAKLEETEYIERKTSPLDKRANLVYLTPKAKKHKAAFQSITSKWTASLLEDFSPTEKELALNYLNKMAETAIKL